MSIGRYF